MKLKLQPKDPGVRVGFTVRASTNAMLDAYLAAYSKASGEPAVAGEVVDAMLRDFMETDKDFMKAYRD